MDADPRLWGFLRSGARSPRRWLLLLLYRWSARLPQRTSFQGFEPSFYARLGTLGPRRRTPLSMLLCHAQHVDGLRERRGPSWSAAPCGGLTHVSWGRLRSVTFTTCGWTNMSCDWSGSSGTRGNSTNPSFSVLVVLVHLLVRSVDKGADALELSICFTSQPLKTGTVFKFAVLNLFVQAISDLSHGFHADVDVTNILLY